MRWTRRWGYAVASILLTAGVTLPASAAHAVDVNLHFDSGQACSFALDVSGTGGNSGVGHVTNEVIISGGTGPALTFSGNGKSVSFPSNGAASVTRLNPDGSPFLVQLTGHNVVFLFPTDITQGPSTTLIVGRAVISINSMGQFQVLSISGEQIDICALLS
jgi:hypothetical protein